jgi:hypothetical protein
MFLHCVQQSLALDFVLGVDVAVVLRKLENCKGWRSINDLRLTLTELRTPEVGDSQPASHRSVSK